MDLDEKLRSSSISCKQRSYQNLKLNGRSLSLTSKSINSFIMYVRNVLYNESKYTLGDLAL